MAALAYRYAKTTGQEIAGATSWQDITGSSTSALVSGVPYWIIACAQVGENDAAQPIGLRILHGSTAFPGSAGYPTSDNSPYRHGIYFWSTIWTPSSAESLKAQGQLWSDTHHGDIDVLTILAVPLDHGTANVDYFIATDATPADMSDGGTRDGASLTFTPPSGGDHWLVWGYNQIGTDSLSVSYESYLQVNSGTPTAAERQNTFETPQVSYVPNPTTLLQSALAVWVLNAESQTYSMHADLNAAGTGGESLIYSQIMALNLDTLFHQYSYSFTDMATTVTGVSTSDYGSLVKSVSITPDEVGPLVAIAHARADNTASTTSFTGRLQIDNSDMNTGVTAAAMDLTFNLAPVNDAANLGFVGFLTGASAATHTIDWDMGCNSTGMDIDDACLVAISLFEVSTSYQDSSSDGVKVGDSGSEVAILPTAGADAHKLSDSSSIQNTMHLSKGEAAKFGDSAVGLLANGGIGTDGAKFGESTVVHQRGPASQLKIIW